MEKDNKRIIVVLSAFMIVFVALILYMTYFQVVKADKIADNDYNKRLWVDENKIKRGTIYDRDGVALVETKKDEEGNNYRIFNYGFSYANITGYSSKKYGKHGLEKEYTNELLNISEKTPLQDIKDMVHTKTEGNSLILTTNTELQKKAFNELEGHKGAIVVMNPKTGEVYAMANRPSYDPNTLTANWDSIVNDEDSPLLNRATQGKYTPGSVFKIVTSTGLLENKDTIDLVINDQKGYVEIGGNRFNNHDKSPTGRTDLTKALTLSSNVYFAEKGVELGEKRFRDLADRYLLGQAIPFDLPTSKSTSPFTDKNLGNPGLAAVSFGQGDTLLSPLHMALITSTIANEGVMMKPYLVQSVKSPEGEIVKQTEPEVLQEVTSKEVANDLLGRLVTAAGPRVQIRGVKVAGKSGTAEIKDKTSTHAWYVATAPADNPKFVVAVVLEDDNTSGVKTAAPIARDVLREAIRQIGLK